MTLEKVEPRYTLAEIAEALGVTKQAAQKRANKDGWGSEEAGNKRLYPLASLPAEVGKALQTTAMHAALPAIAQEVAAPVVLAAPGHLLTDKQRLERDARGAVLSAVQRLMVDGRCSQEHALTTLLTTARAGRLDAHTDKLLKLARDPRGRAGDGYPSVRTLKRWLTAGDLTPKVQQKNMTVPAWAKDFLAIHQVPQKPSVDASYRQFTDRWPGISIHQVRRFLDKLGVVTRERGRMGTRELKNIRPFIRRDWSDFQPNDAWIADGHCFDAEVQHPLHGRPFRPEITVFIDGGTRRVTVGTFAAGHLGLALQRVEHGLVHLYFTLTAVGFCLPCIQPIRIVSQAH